MSLARRRIRAITTVATGAVAVVLATAQVASAQGNWFLMQTDDDNPGGHVVFEPEYDGVKLADKQDDGYAVHITVWKNKGNDYLYDFYNARGEGKWTYRSNRSGPRFDLPENTCLKFRIRLTKGVTKNVVPGTTDFATWQNANGNHEPQYC
ncbi:hypothetical protein [Streptomyces sp. MZ04]|uniref:hypothetical protein n=1 Tax=Streptomyces sp. MZ04 TaxID=2559236 RepID=UPI0014333DD7|nr:hypothetical protein [Streptomyces sp. MZ04]